MLLIKNGEPNLKFAPLVLPKTSSLGPVADEIESMEAMRTEPEMMPSITAFNREPNAPAQFLYEAPAHEDPDSIIAQAHAEAERILAQAHARAGEVERAAREKAIAEARASIDSEVAAELEPLRAQMTETLSYVTDLREQMATYAEHELVQLAIEIARKIVRREVTVDREIVISLARVALARLRSRALATVYLHPDDYQYVTANRDRLGAGNTVKLIEDATISRGGCLIETDLGHVDARIEQQFSEIERGFFHGLDAQ